MFHRRRAHKARQRQKRKRPRLRLESRDARRTALPRSLLTTTLRSDLRRGNGSNVPPGTLWAPPQPVRVAYLARHLQEIPRIHENSLAPNSTYRRRTMRVYDRITTTIERGWLAQNIAGTKKIAYRQINALFDAGFSCCCFSPKVSAAKAQCSLEAALKNGRFCTESSVFSGSQNPSLARGNDWA
jgi:hypothetical protein